MNEHEFLAKLIEVMDLETGISMEAVLKDYEEWDSLSMVSFAAMVNTSCGKVVPIKDIKKANTVVDLYALITK